MNTVKIVHYSSHNSQPTVETPHNAVFSVLPAFTPIQTQTSPSASHLKTPPPYVPPLMYQTKFRTHINTAKLYPPYHVLYFHTANSEFR
jgi:hypothetical protein